MKYILLLLLIGLTALSCTENVPPGYVGMKMTPDGIEDEVLKPGRHSCYNRDKMILVERVEQTYTEKLKILCKDELNFKFDLKIRSTLNADSSKKLKNLLDKQGSHIKWKSSVGKLKYGQVYVTYVRPLARSIARQVVSQYETRAISGARSEIQAAIFKKLIASIANSPVKVTMVAISNLDYPAVITEAMEKKKKREIQIEQEKATQAIKLLRATNRLKIAQKMKIVRVAEGEAESAYMKILGSGATKTYLRLREIETKLALYKNIGKGDKLIITNGNTVVPVINTGSSPRSVPIPIPKK